MLENNPDINEIPEKIIGENLLFSEDSLKKFNEITEDGYCDIPEESETEKNFSGFSDSFIDSLIEDDSDIKEEFIFGEKEETEFSVENDDKGEIYKSDRNLLPGTDYKLNGITFSTDNFSRIVSAEGSVKLNPENGRNLYEQRTAGGEERLENDQGGHIFARVFGGPDGMENLVPMRDVLNQGDYKKMELKIKNALIEGKDVFMSVKIEYEGDSVRPSGFVNNYSIDGINTEEYFDNNENSTCLTRILKDNIDKSDCKSLSRELDDMKKDNVQASVLSVCKEDNFITACIFNETDGTKTYKTYNAS